VESFPPEQTKRLGIDYDKLRCVNSRIIHTSITPFGESGPYKNYKSSDLIAMAMAASCT